MSASRSRSAGAKQFQAFSRASIRTNRYSVRFSRSISAVNASATLPSPLLALYRLKARFAEVQSEREYLPRKRCVCPAPPASSGSAIRRLNGAGSLRRSGSIRNSCSAGPRSRITAAQNPEYGFNCGRTSRSTTAAGNGIFGCRDEAPKIVIQTRERRQRPKSGK
jgi:hypothetical protein